MTGKRKYPDKDGQLLLKSGEYGKSEAGTWFACPPNYHTGCLARHNVIEHDDGTITASPSILIYDANTKWHGYLEHGVWRAV